MPCFEDVDWMHTGHKVCACSAPCACTSGSGTLPVRASSIEHLRERFDSVSWSQVRVIAGSEVRLRIVGIRVDPTEIVSPDA